MSGLEYRIYVDDEPASRELSHAIEQIEVSQLTGAPWEAQLVIPVCMDRRGAWDHEAEHYVDSRTRFRVELYAGGAWVPLIDGVTTGADLGMSGDPGQSSITVRVRDDLYELERDREPQVFRDGLAIGDVVRQLFQERDHIEAEPEVDSIDSDAHLRHAEDEIAMTEPSCYDFLRRLADDHGMYVYVLPAEARGRSRAYFGAMPRPSGERPPPLVLAGPQRNIERFDVRADSDRPGRATARTINVRDRVVDTTTVYLSDRELAAGTEAAADEAVDAPISPRELAAAGPSSAATAALERGGYVVRASGAVDGRCYPGVLRPYSHVEVRGVNQRLCGMYLVHMARHTLSRAGYRQAFELWRNTFVVPTETTSGVDASGMVPW